MHRADYFYTKKSYDSWVYILEREDGYRSVHYTFDLVRVVSFLPLNLRLLFYRGFFDPMDSIAYKVFIENLSPQSIDRIVRMKNPELRNLCEDFQSTEENK